MYGGSIAASFKQIHLRDSTNQISLKAPERFRIFMFTKSITTLNIVSRKEVHVKLYRNNPKICQQQTKYLSYFRMLLIEMFLQIVKSSTDSKDEEEEEESNFANVCRVHSF